MPDQILTFGQSLRERVIPVAISRKVQAAAASVGNFLEFYNFMAYAFFAPMIGQAFFPVHNPLMQLLAALITFAAGFAARPVGAFVMGLYATRAGVSKTLMVTFLMMAVGSALLVVTPTYAQIGIAAPVLILLSRLLHGFSDGGEVGPATDFLYALGGKHDAGAFASAQALTQFAAGLVAVAVGFILSSVLTHDQLYSWGWRVPFVLGLSIVPVGLFFRRIAITGVLPHQQPAAGHPQERVSPVVVAMAFGVILTGTVTTYLRTFGASYAISVLHLSPAIGMAAMAIGLAAGIGSIIVGIALHRLMAPRRVIVGAYAAYCLLILPAYYYSVHAPGLASQIVLNLVANMLTGLVSATSYDLMLRAIPASRRTFVFGLIYSLAVSIFGGATQPFVTWLIAVTSDPLVPGYVGACVAPIAPLALLVLLHRAKQPSHSDDHAEPYLSEA
ncbi:major facilitator transporter [Ameyamaea chiangmaiensis NBRC 103196]|uniref:Major facilitator superfamily (MFS) profile domain-containing protein n=1 Tax=Ameyamaea chiangmaiensis TaxID=442969 RepID=A0A850P6K0_9PROT|nr:MFS transporter [Ameyamaea chiangmaiensis]MBS4075692.1 hypothetical protein [Ameyamaea chiangmaiensis]NVN40265.1 hypothetical protein [Ameyamaea chiangmaiensis]GBQ70493.1 major facilitator transporter [Ameyamaea chiangmaiensis NBRC 103196]